MSFAIAIDPAEDAPLVAGVDGVRAARRARRDPGRGGKRDHGDAAEGPAGLARSSPDGAARPLRGRSRRRGGGLRALPADRRPGLRAARPCAERTSSRSPTRPPASGSRWSRSAATAAASWRRTPTSTFCSCYPYKRTPHSEQMIEYLLYKLWDLGLKVGQATRSIGECLRFARTDIGVCTSLLEARFLWGDRPTFDTLRERFESEVVAGMGAGVRRGQARRARRPAPAHRRQPLSARAQRQGGQGRPARPADPVLARPVPLPDQGFRRAGRAWRADPRRAAQVRPRAPLPLGGALPSALSHRARRGAPDLRSAARDRASPGLSRPQDGARRRAPDEALLPGRQGGRRADPDLLRRARGAASAPAAPSASRAWGWAGAGSTAW